MKPAPPVTSRRDMRGSLGEPTPCSLVEVRGAPATSLETTVSSGRGFEAQALNAFTPQPPSASGPPRMAAHEGDHPGRRHGLAPAPDHAGDQQAADAGLRQADDLLPDLDADARGHPRYPRHHHSSRGR